MHDTTCRVALLALGSCLIIYYKIFGRITSVCILKIVLIRLSVICIISSSNVYRPSSISQIQQAGERQRAHCAPCARFTCFIYYNRQSTDMQCEIDLSRGSLKRSCWSHQSRSLDSRACERSGIGAENGAGRKLSERERNGERTKLAAQISLKGDVILKLRNVLQTLFSPCQK